MLRQFGMVRFLMRFPSRMLSRSGMAGLEPRLGTKRYTCGSYGACSFGTSRKVPAVNKAPHMLNSS